MQLFVVGHAVGGKPMAATSATVRAVGSAAQARKKAA